MLKATAWPKMKMMTASPRSLNAKLGIPGGRLRSLLGQQQAAPKVQSKPVKATKAAVSSNPAPKGIVKQEAPKKEVTTKAIVQAPLPAPKKPTDDADLPLVLDGRGHRLQQPGP